MLPDLPESEKALKAERTDHGKTAEALRETAEALRAERAEHAETAEALRATQARLAELEALRRQP